jgi:hypothetical protein
MPPKPEAGQRGINNRVPTGGRRHLKLGSTTPLFPAPRDHSNRTPSTPNPRSQFDLCRSVRPAVTRLRAARRKWAGLRNVWLRPLSLRATPVRSRCCVVSPFLTCTPARPSRRHLLNREQSSSFETYAPETGAKEVCFPRVSHAPQRTCSLRLRRLRVCVGYAVTRAEEDAARLALRLPFCFMFAPWTTPTISSRSSRSRTTRSTRSSAGILLRCRRSSRNATTSRSRTLSGLLSGDGRKFGTRWLEPRSTTGTGASSASIGSRRTSRPRSRAFTS